MKISASREQRRQLTRDNANQPAMLTQVPESAWPAVPWVKKPFAVWRSRDYLVQGYGEDNRVTRISRFQWRREQMLKVSNQLDAKLRCKCQHCGQMTRVRP